MAYKQMQKFVPVQKTEWKSNQPAQQYVLLLPPAVQTSLLEVLKTFCLGLGFQISDTLSNSLHRKGDKVVICYADLPGPSRYCLLHHRCHFRTYVKL